MIPAELPYYLQGIMDWTRNSNAERKEIWTSSAEEFLFHLKNIIFFKKSLTLLKKYCKIKAEKTKR